ncbi:membrane associated RING finger, putative [Perkinsus marinus ATCC 50983]|uniref:Membrane associated RING finger, putative n=1 Tax=Perkinsus marinus (strain ATCC 50983 / TXsc) TaxID=423536 RepID=C5L030_PERM5|nr:membrane associated RING finger, putative [Perkinsus marinus ATCC 50983]EER09888.1 membrane associated RING finger, putative [Perkinsus marinus ATCC 50983]|eukprot:XP_002778093.1 membrane associated RING finger, putative [Perkinsus marinus ATCC 50983]
MGPSVLKNRGDKVPTDPTESDASDESTELLCRICFSDGETKGNELIAPCMCKGSQKYVHVSCLRRWQRATQALGPGDFMSDKATTCSVCQGRFALSPPERPLWERLWALAKDLMLTLFTITFAIFLNRSLIFVGVMAVMLVLAYRCPILCALMAIGLCASLHSFGIRPVITHDDEGGFRVALIRHGAPVPNFHKGALLVANDNMIGPGSIFYRSVALVLEHDHMGSLALILNKPVARSPIADYRDAAEGPPVELLTVRGGPVRINEERRIMHQARGVVGARVLLSQDREDSVYLGGDLTAVLAGIAQQDRGAGDERAHAIIFDGCARWAPGQLYGELRAGSWRWINPPWPEEILLSAFDQHGAGVDNGEAMYHMIMNDYGEQLIGLHL